MITTEANIRAAVLDVVDGSQYLQWMWDENDEANANATRQEFADLLIARLAHYKVPVLCARHRGAVEPEQVEECVECAKEKLHPEDLEDVRDNTITTPSRCCNAKVKTASEKGNWQNRFYLCSQCMRPCQLSTAERLQ